MLLKELQAHLENNFVASATQGLDATFCLTLATERLAFRVCQQKLEFIDASRSQCDATFHFDDVDAASDLLSGRRDVLASFMKGQFRADGYLVWAFLLMAMFRVTSVQ